MSALPRKWGGAGGNRRLEDMVPEAGIEPARLQ